MRKCLIVIGTAWFLASCGSSAASSPKSPSGGAGDENSVANNSGVSSRGTKKKSVMNGWSDVPPLESHSVAGVGNRKSRVTITSNPTKHGDALHFRFLVNAVPISGVFSAPGGQVSTFTIPVGTVHFTVDECEGDTQGFELGPDEDIPIHCELTTEGDCCEVAITVDAKPKK